MYEQVASIAIDTDGMSIVQVADAVLSQLRTAQ
jgi:hypothetical protein